MFNKSYSLSLSFEDDCVPNGSTGKVAAWGFLCIHEI